MSNEGIGTYLEEMLLHAGLFDDNPHTVRTPGRFRWCPLLSMLISSMFSILNCARLRKGNERRLTGLPAAAARGHLALLPAARAPHLHRPQPRLRHLVHP